MAYTLGDIITELQTKAKDSSLAQTLLTYFVNDAQNNILGANTYSFMEKQATDTSLSIGQSTVNFPADHQATIDVVLIDPVYTTIVTQLSYVPYELFYEAYPNPSALPQATPTVWTDYGHQLLFNCPADKTYTYRFRYIRTPIVLSNLTDVPDVPSEFRHALVAYGMGAIEEYRDNFAFASAYNTKGDQYAEDLAIRWGSRQYGSPTVLNNQMGFGNVLSATTDWTQ